MLLRHPYDLSGTCVLRVASPVKLLAIVLKDRIDKEHSGFKPGADIGGSLEINETIYLRLYV